MKGYPEIIWDNYKSCCWFFVCSAFSPLLHLLSESSQFCAVLSCLLSLDGLLIHIPLALPAPAASLPLHRLCSPQHAVLMRSVLAGKWHLLNSPGEILLSLKLVAKFPLTSAWPEFHPSALKCSVLLRASTSVSSALLGAVWLHQKLEQKEWCHGATGLGRSFLAARCCISLASEGVEWQIYPRACVSFGSWMEQGLCPILYF